LSNPIYDGFHAGIVATFIQLLLDEVNGGFDDFVPDFALARHGYLFIGKDKILQDFFQRAVL
jgi:hypothetical protein